MKLIRLHWELRLLKDDKRIQSIDSIELYAYEISKDVIHKNDAIKFNYIIKQYKQWLILMRLQAKAGKNTIQIGHQFLIIHTKYW